MDKWLSEDKSKKKEQVKEEREYSLEKINEAKVQRIRNLVGKKFSDKSSKIKQETDGDDFITTITEFKLWLNQRTYLKGDLDKIEVWIKILNRKLYSDDNKKLENDDKKAKGNLKEQFKRIPPTFLEEKIRIAINRKLNGMKKTSSDTYYLRKLKVLIQDKFKEVEYYKILKQILKF